MPIGQRRQFCCNTCNRVWNGEPNVTSICFSCRAAGELVPEGQEIELQQFQCTSSQCDGQAWYARRVSSTCRDCGVTYDPLPLGIIVEYHQFVCENADCRELGRRWEKMATRSKCRICNHYGRMVPTGEEIGVFICKFRCDCEQCDCPTDRLPYTSRCRMQCTTICYRCRGMGHNNYRNSPYTFRPRRFGIKKMTDNVHGCSDCNDGSKDCPNTRSSRVLAGAQ